MYTLNISAADTETIFWVGSRYAWSDALIALGRASAGTHEIPPREAWELHEACESDTEGGHAYFPLLADGELRDKLYAFLESIV